MRGAGKAILAVFPNDSNALTKKETGQEMSLSKGMEHNFSNL